MADLHSPEYMQALRILSLTRKACDAPGNILHLIANDCADTRQPWGSVESAYDLRQNFSKTPLECDSSN